MSAVSFVFNLIDQMSGPAKKIAKAVGETGEATKKADKAVAPLPGRLGKVQEALKEAYGEKASAMMGRFVNGTANASDAAKAAQVGFKGLKAGAGVAAEGASKLAGGLATVAAVAASAAAAVGAAGLGLVAAGAKYALDMFRFRQNTEFAWKYTQGSQQQAAGTMALAAQLAGELGQSTQDVAAQMNEIFKSGAKASEARGIVKVLADLKALGAKQDPRQLSEALMAMAKGGALSPETLKPLTELGDGAKAKVYESLATKLGIKAKDDDARQKLVDAALAQGAFKGQKGIQAYQDALQNVTGQGSVGGLGKLFNDTTIDGSIDKIKGKVSELFAKLNSGEAGTKLVEMLQKVAAAIDPSTDSGKKLLATIDKIAGAAGRLLGKIDMGQIVNGFEMLLGAVDAVLAPLEAFGGEAIDSIKEVFSTVADAADYFGGASNSTADLTAALKVLGSAFGYIVGGAVVGIGAIVYLEAKLAGIAAFVLGAAGSIGLAIIDGITGGLDSAKAKLMDRLRALANLLPDTVRQLLGIHSPSKVFAEIGSFTMQGFVQGVDSEAANVRDVTLSTLSPRMAQLGQGAGGGAAGGARNVTVNNTIEISGASDPGAVRKAAEEGATAGTMRVFELLGLETGAAGATS